MTWESRWRSKVSTRLPWSNASHNSVALSYWRGRRREVVSRVHKQSRRWTRKWSRPSSSRMSSRKARISDQRGLRNSKVTFSLVISSFSPIISLRSSVRMRVKCFNRNCSCSICRSGIVWFLNEDAFVLHWYIFSSMFSYYYYFFQCLNPWGITMIS